jgi:transposase
VQQAQAALLALPERRRGKARLRNVAELAVAAEAILRQQRVAGLLQVEWGETVQTRPRRAYRGRPAGVREERTLWLQVRVDEGALRQAVQVLGWRVYVTNAPVEELSLEEAVRAYREEYLVEHSFGRLKGQPLSLCPMYLAKEEHATGLVRLLSLGLRVLSLLEFEVRRRLEAEGAVVPGLYAGNPQRTTARPTAEGLLGCFQDINLSMVTQAGQTQGYLPPLSAVQQRILALLGFAPSIYERLVAHSANPP